jgi:hypothetical protein
MRATGTDRRLLVVLTVALSALAGLQLWNMLRVEPLAMDFLPLWTAGRMVWSDPGKVYDFAAITSAQGWLPQPHFAWTRPYAYPPTTLLLMAPLGRLPYWAAVAAWSVGSLGAFLYATARLAARDKTMTAGLAAVLPAVVIAVTAGQTVVLASALLALAALDLEQRPRIAGALLALSAVVKPEAALAAPVALLASGAFEALLSAGLAAAAMIGATMILFGPGRWSEWTSSLPAFQHLIGSIPGLGPALITPFWTARELGLGSVGASAVAAAFALAGAWLTWTTFRQRNDPVLRCGALAVGSLLASPFALCFDATLIVPAVAALSIRALALGQVTMAVLALAAALAVTAPHLGLLALLLFAAVLMVGQPPSMLSPDSLRPESEADLPMQRQRSAA